MAPGCELVDKFWVAGFKHQPSGCHEYEAVAELFVRGAQTAVGVVAVVEAAVLVLGA